MGFNGLFAAQQFKGCACPRGWVVSRRGSGFESCRRFLDPPYHSVRRVFPSTAGRLPFASDAFLDDQRLKPAPGIRRPPSSLHRRLSRTAPGRGPIVHRH